MTKATIYMRMHRFIPEHMCLGDSPYVYGTGELNIIVQGSATHNIYLINMLAFLQCRSPFMNTQCLSSICIN